MSERHLFIIGFIARAGLYKSCKTVHHMSLIRYQFSVLKLENKVLVCSCQSNNYNLKYFSFSHSTRLLAATTLRNVLGTKVNTLLLGLKS